MLFKLGHVEDIVDTYEPTPEVQSVGCLPFVLHHPERSYKPSSELPSACQIKGLCSERHFFSHQILLQSVVLIKVALLVVLGSLQMILGVLD